jgi:hypothetical protein
MIPLQNRILIRKECLSSQAMTCRHLEVHEFGTYSVDMDDTIQVTTLQKCSLCGANMTLGGSIVPDKRILSREPMKNAKMRTITAQLNSELYDRLHNLAAAETGEKGVSNIMNEVVALGLKHYRQNFSTD